MTSERWQRIADIFHAAQDRQGDERAAFVRQAADNSDVRREVESLLAADEEPMVLDHSIAATAHAVLIDNAPVHPGTYIAGYRIDSLLGVGGMGEVYRARDTTLNRDVAIKILPTAVASDPERLARFKREAQVLASLNHPNIGAIHGFEVSDGIHALVLELVEGPTLADIIAGSGLSASGSGPRAQGPGGDRPKAQSPKPKALSVREALAIAGQIANALEAAHELGIVHRDLKPANIKVREDGTVKVLDFGLAKITEAGGAGRPGGAGADLLTQSPTITTPAMTAAGIILGTAAYMSPEQAKGKPADKRSDIWAFGVVLYEMLTGERPFKGDDVADTLASVLRAEPDWSRLPSTTPPAVQRLLRRALTKPGAQRTGDVTSVKLDLDDASEPLPPPLTPPARRRSLVTTVAVSFLITAVAVAAWWTARASNTASEPSEVRVDIATPDSGEPGSVAISPDGTKLLYVLDDKGRSEIVLRDLGTGEVRTLAGTTGGVLPFWSPDGRAIGFFADGWLKRLDLAGGPPRNLAAAPGGRAGGTWAPDGTIIFIPAGNSQDALRVSENGGQTTSLGLQLDGQRLLPRGPHVLPDGAHFTFYSVNGSTRALFVASLDGTGARLLTATDTSAVYARGHLLFGRGSILFAQPFDLRELRLSGEPFPVAEPFNSAFNGLASLSASRDGVLAYRRAVPGDRRQLVWFNRRGERVGGLGEVDGNRIASPNLSHDERRVAVGRTIGRIGEVWTFDLTRAGWTRVTSDGQRSQPVWSADDSQLAMVGTNSGQGADILLSPSRPGGVIRPLVVSPPLKGTTDWSPDGHHLLFTVTDIGKPQDIWAYSFADQKAFPLLQQSSADENNAKFSPDGQWIAYESNQSGRFEIYIQRFGANAEPFQVSDAGGAQVRWRKNGRELFYIDLQGQLTAVPVTLPTGTGAPVIGHPAPLFRVRVPGGTIQPGGARQQYDVAADGERFLVNTILPDATPAPLSLIFHWRADGRARIAP